MRLLRAVLACFVRTAACITWLTSCQGFLLHAIVLRIALLSRVVKNNAPQG
jgi:hypothetical protein